MQNTKQIVTEAKALIQAGKNRQAMRLVNHWCFDQAPTELATNMRIGRLQSLGLGWFGAELRIVDRDGNPAA